MSQFRNIPIGDVVYALYRGREVAYVGSTNNPYQRLYVHRKKGMPMDTVKISFDRRYGESRMREVRLIAKIGPFINEVHKVGRSKAWIGRGY